MWDTPCLTKTRAPTVSDVARGIQNTGKPNISARAGNFTPPPYCTSAYTPGPSRRAIAHTPGRLRCVRHVGKADATVCETPIYTSYFRAGSYRRRGGVLIVGS